jgi:ribosomal protein S18 acetylase RimI-like enzyme
VKGLSLGARRRCLPCHLRPCGCATLQRRQCCATRRQLERWQRQRQFAVLLAEDAGTGRLLGAVTLSLTRCEAALPPPFPTSKLLRCPRRYPPSGASLCRMHQYGCIAGSEHLTSSRYAFAHCSARWCLHLSDHGVICMLRRLYVSNMVTASEARRRGVATQLLHACMRLGESACALCPLSMRQAASAAPQFGSIFQATTSCEDRQQRRSVWPCGLAPPGANAVLPPQADGGAVTAPGCMWRSATQLGWASTRCARTLCQLVSPQQETSWCAAR